MTITSVATIPSTWSMSVSETWDLTVDEAGFLEVGQTITSVTSTLVSIQSGLSITLATSPHLSGGTVIQRIVGPVDLVTPGRYLLTLICLCSAGPSGSDETKSSETVIVAVV